MPNYINTGKKYSTLADAPPIKYSTLEEAPPKPVVPSLSSLEENLKSIQAKTQELFSKMNEGVVGKSGEILLPAGYLNDAPNLQIPQNVIPQEVKDSNQNIFDFSGGFNQLQTNYENFLKTYETKLSDLETKKAEAQKKVEAGEAAIAAEPVISSADLLEQERKKWGIPEMYEQIQTMLPEITSLRSQINDLNTKESEALDKISENPNYSLQFAGREGLRVQHEYERRRSSLSGELASRAAIASALSGNMAQAESFAGNAVNALTYDSASKLKGMTDFLEINKDFVDALSEEEKGILSEVKNYWQDKLNLERDERTSVLDLMLKAPTSGIVASDDLEVAYEKAQTWLATQPAEITYEVPKGLTGQNYNTRLKEEISNAFSGRYGGYETPYIRENLIAMLSREFPSVSKQQIQNDIYSRLPAGWESNVGAAQDFFSEIFQQAVQEEMAKTE